MGAEKWKDSSFQYDGWEHTFDNNFALDFLKSSPLSKPPAQLAPVQCCTCCALIGAADCQINLSDVTVGEKNCQLCALLLRTAKRHCNDYELKGSIVRKGSALESKRRGTKILRLYSDLECSADTGEDVQIGFPVLPEVENPARFALLRAWLSWCDHSHNCNKHNTASDAALPTRLLYIGDPDDPNYDPNFLRLDHAEKINGRKYISLSHCWGGADKNQFCTTQDNIDRRQEGFSILDLPKTFKDAIKVARELHVPYLWIDSLCIIQDGDNGKDWEHESNRMEEVFSGAYCTIAATSAVDSNAGFLDRNISSEYIYVQDASGRRFYIGTNIDDFDNDVDEARLNRRAWVMQEKVLSGRTIHFSANQTYFECGQGVYCESLTRLKSHYRKKHFLLDPTFPDRLIKSGNESTIEFIHFLFEDYSKRGLTMKTDRCVAMSGLEARIAAALGCQSRYGIFPRYLHRNLLWQSSDNKMERIEYKTQNVPSWSWMAYSGGIQFVDIHFGMVDWIGNLRFDEECESALITDVGKFRNCTMKPDGENYAILNFFRLRRGWIQYDVEAGKNLREERCVVIGKTSILGDDAKDYYILVVRPTSVDGEYTRVGVGMIQRDYVVRERLNVRVV
ncbi:HET-domain-containing protein [Lepidopterella palustris CBS 459.81]|uniref:HET-domain-containing protein n=1 Tax=Lepidopterella palustris CBS 459.81 TaxID=1314670 RepID=A0A8E2DZN8_9PEZI|nr:HET-domain-containing protein [Lepidopterella palustris CBS 459.81]